MVEGFGRAAVYSGAYFYLRHRLTDPALSATGGASSSSSGGSSIFSSGGGDSGSGSNPQALSVRDACAIGAVTSALAALISYPMQVRGSNAMQPNDAQLSDHTRREYRVFCHRFK
jgi:hypothetical protein